MPAEAAKRTWAVVTARVAWVLRSRLKSVPPDLLLAARDHVLLHLDDDTTPHIAEDLAEQHTVALIHRIKRRTHHTPWAEDARIELDPAWRDALWRVASHPAMLVLRLHHAGGLSLDRIAANAQIDPIALKAAKEGLRDVMRALLQRSGHRAESWSADRIDAITARVASMTHPNTPPLHEIAAGKHPDAPKHCVTADRVRRLVKADAICDEDLIAEHDGLSKDAHVQVVAVQLHEGFRRHIPTLRRESRGRTASLPDDVLLLDAPKLAAVEQLLCLAAEVGSPPRDAVRGVVLQGRGKWSRWGLLGPVPAMVPGALRSQPWGSVEGLAELPGELPPAPSPVASWAMVAAMAAAAVLLGLRATAPPLSPAMHPLLVDATEGRRGLWLNLTVDDDAHLTIIREARSNRDDASAPADALEVLLATQHIADKVDYATGDGAYRLHAPGSAILVASTQEPIADLATRLQAASATGAPLQALADQLRVDLPDADIWLSPERLAVRSP